MFFYGSMILRNVKSGDCIHILERHTDYVRCIKFESSGDYCSIGSDYSIFLQIIQELTKYWILKQECIQAMKEQQNFLILNRIQIEVEYQLFHKIVRVYIQHHRNYVSCTLFDSTGGYCATGSADKTCKIWNLNTGKCIQTFTEHQKEISNICYNSEGTRLATVSADFTGRVYNVQTGECISQLLGHSGNIGKVQFHQSKNIILTASSDKTARIYLETGDSLQALDDYDSKIFTCSFNTQGNIIIIGSGYNKIWKQI